MRRGGRQTDLSTAMARLSGTLNRQSKGRFLQVRVSDEWDKLAGERVAAHTTGVHLREGELVVKVDSPIWATELSALAGPYAKGMNEALGKDWVKAVRFTVSKAVDERRLRERMEEEKEASRQPDPFDPIPLTAQELADVEASVPDVGDEDLRRAVIRATVAGLEWEKGRKQSSEAQNPSGAL